jgi:hypothetical protein
MRWCRLLLLAFVGCAKVFDLEHVEVPRDAAVVHDAAPRTPFSDPIEVVQLRSPQGYLSDDPSLRRDQLELYFNSNRPDGLGAHDIWYSTRASVSDPWGVPVLATFNTIDNDNSPRLHIEGLELYFAYATGSTFNLYRITRQDLTAPWGMRAAIPELNSPPADYEASMTTDRLRVFFGSDRGGSADIWMAERATPMDLWSPPTPVTELNTVDYIEDAPFSQDGLTLYFSTNRPGSFGRTDLWVATRTSLDEPFGTPEPLDEINSIDYEEDPWVSEDGSTLYFASARNGPMRIYMATRSLP